MKRARYFLEAVLLATLMAIFKAMPLDMASAIGGAAGRFIGPRLAASRKALRQVAEALPELTEAEQRKVIAGMWDNLGRVMAEYPHLEKIGRERVTINCAAGVEEMFRRGQPCLIIASHMANWEIGSALMLAHFNVIMDLTYRAPNNPWADRLLMNARSLGGRIRGYAKSRAGGMEIIKAMRAGKTLAIMIDQKYNEGLAIPFFGRPAMTNPVFVQLAHKFNYPVLPAQIERTGGAHFIVTFHEPLAIEGKETGQVILEANAHLERWIRKRPEQWLWLHRRWDSQKLEELNEAA